MLRAIYCSININIVMMVAPSWHHHGGNKLPKNWSSNINIIIYFSKIFNININIEILVAINFQYVDRAIYRRNSNFWQFIAKSIFANLFPEQYQYWLFKLQYQYWIYMSNILIAQNIAWVMPISILKIRLICIPAKTYPHSHSIGTNSLDPIPSVNRKRILCTRISSRFW